MTLPEQSICPANPATGEHSPDWYRHCHPCDWCDDDTPDPDCDCPRCAGRTAALQGRTTL